MNSSILVLWTTISVNTVPKFLIHNWNKNDLWFALKSSIRPNCLLPFVSSSPLWRHPFYALSLSNNFFSSPLNPVPPVTVLLALKVPPQPLNYHFCCCGVSPTYGGWIFSDLGSIGARRTVHTSPILSTCTATTANAPALNLTQFKYTSQTSAFFEDICRPKETQWFIPYIG